MKDKNTGPKGDDAFKTKRPAYRIACGIGFVVFATIAFRLLGDQIYGVSALIVAYAAWDGMIQGR